MDMRVPKMKAAMAVVGLTGILGLAVPAVAQNTGGDMNKMDQAKTGVGERGTKVAPSTEPGQANQGTAGAGKESRGSRTAPPSNEEGKPTTGH
jgi:hypothetical protein